MRKQAIFLYLSLIFFLSNCTKENSKTIFSPYVNEVFDTSVNALIIHSTSTDDYNCGNWSWSLRDYFINNNYNNKVKVISAYINNINGISKLNTSIAEAWAMDFYSSNLPSFVTNFKDGILYPDTLQTKDNINNAINNYISNTALASTNFDVQKDENFYLVNTRTKFFWDVGEDYYIGAYIIEDNVIASQNGSSGTNFNIHRNVLRSGNVVLGELLNKDNGGILANEVISKTVKIPYDSKWKESNIFIVTIIWNHSTTTKWRYINSNWN